eukprot:5913412-Pleurochrysis_carterae.AAC.2
MALVCVLSCEAILQAKKSVEVPLPVIARDTGPAIFKCPESVPVRAAASHSFAAVICSSLGDKCRISKIYLAITSRYHRLNSRHTRTHFATHDPADFSVGPWLA